jgi:cellulose synthase/poly-beta-1,6-N-acetylglucosamine synthase-like glycosyltransferase
MRCPGDGEVSGPLPWALVCVSLVLFGISAATVWWMLHAWRDPVTYHATGFAREAGLPTLSFSLLVPARHEETVLEQTLEQLRRLDYPMFEVIVIVGHDDPRTAAVAHAAAARHPDCIRVVTDRNWPKNKPKALNSALPSCVGDVVGVFDAEDEVDRRLLRAVDSAFRATDAEVVQGGVQLVNLRSSWFSLRNCLEYFFWFRSRLHLHEHHRFIPLGGNTVFVRTDLLRAVGGWDADCLAEDCELGVRLSALGAMISVCYDPHLVTREETPDTLLSLLKQRTRWNQGFLQVLKKGEWRRLPTRGERLLARYTLAQPFLQAFAGIGIPFAVVTALVARAPVGVALITFLPAMPTVAMVIFEAVGLREFCRVYYVRPRTLDYVRLLVGAPFYQVVLAIAACRAVLRELRGQRGWEKTAHSGAHRDAGALPVIQSPQAERQAA